MAELETKTDKCRRRIGYAQRPHPTRGGRAYVRGKPEFRRFAEAGILGLGQALGEDKIEVSMPPEAVGFNGKLSGQVAKPVSNGWFSIKVVKVLSLSSSNKTKLKAKALTAVWKDKYVAVRGVKDMPQLKVGDMVIVTAYQLRCTSARRK